MGMIQELLQSSNTICKLYLYLTECELKEEYDEVSKMKEILKRLVIRENMLLNKILVDQKQMLAFAEYLSGFIGEESIDIQIFSNESSEYIIMMRLFNKFSSRIIRMNNDELSKIANDDIILKQMGVPSSERVNITVFKWIVSNILESSFARNKIVLLDSYLNDSVIPSDDYLNFIRYKTFSNFIDPNLEYYYLNNIKMDNSIPKIISNPNIQSFIKQDVYNIFITEKMLCDINYLINDLLFGEFNNKLSCSREVLSVIYLLELETLLSFIDEDNRYKIESAVNMGIHHFFDDIVDSDNLDRIDEVINVFDKVKQKELSKR